VVVLEVEHLRLPVAKPECQPPVADDDGTNRHVPGSIDLPGTLERTPHEGDI
jgi:hypothetical protein